MRDRDGNQMHIDIVVARRKIVNKMKRLGIKGQIYRIDIISKTEYDVFVCGQEHEINVTISG
jgi:hypothetical protein